MNHLFDPTIRALSRINLVFSDNRGRYILVMEETSNDKDLRYEIETMIFNLQEISRRSLSSGAWPFLATVIPQRDWIWSFPQGTERSHPKIAVSSREYTNQVQI